MPEKHNPDVEKYKDKAVGVITSLGMVCGDSVVCFVPYLYSVQRAEARNKDAVRDIRREFDAVAEDVDRQAKKARTAMFHVIYLR